MKDKNKTKAQLIAELGVMRQRVAHLETLAADRQQIAEALQDSEQQFVAFMDNLPAAVFIKDEASRIRYVNQYMKEHPCIKIVDLDFNLQYMSRAGIDDLKIDDITEFYGKPYPFYFYPESFRKRMNKSLNSVTETGEIITSESSTVDKKGKELWYHSTFLPV